MQTFNALSYGDKWRVSGYLRRGEAPRDARMAVAAVELGESYQRRGRVYTTAIRWWPVVAIVIFGFTAIPAVAEANTLQAILFAVLVLATLGQLAVDPAMRPKNIARSLEASRRVLASVD